METTLDTFDILKGAITDFLKYDASEFAVASTMYDIILPLALILCVVYFLIELSDMLTREHFNSDQFIKAMIKLAISVILVEHIDVFICAICNCSNAVVSLLGDTDLGTIITEMNIGSTSGSNVSFGGQAASTVLEIIVDLILFLPLLLIRTVIEVMILLEIFKMKIEVIIKAGFSPLGVADMVAGGMHSSAIRFIKSFAGSAFQLSVTAFALSVASSVTVAMASNGNVPFMLTACIAYVIIFGVIKGVSSISRDLF